MTFSSEKGERLKLSFEQLLCLMGKPRGISTDTEKMLQKHKENQGDVHCRRQEVSLSREKGYSMELTSKKRSREKMTDKGLLDLATWKVIVTF